ncbi:MAG: glycosyltransferase [Chloroflexi bacterium]|nr:glycosyltransferase [Chloroflexota bacterium]
MPSPVSVTPKSLEEYRRHVGDDVIAEIEELARPLRGARVLHLNATAYGGGVAELLNSIIPLLQDLGIAAEWQVIDAHAEFFNVTKSMHNAMQGMYIPWSNAMADTWREVNQANAEAITERYDYVYVHDPQPAGLLHYVRLRDAGGLGAKWIWRCHLDTTEALPEVWDFLRGYVELYDAAVFTMEGYVKSRLGPQLAIIPPAIDPTSTKNTPLPKAVVREVLQRYEIDPDRPIIAQISRFDPWKDPLGVIDTYRILKEHRPGLQLLMVASMADDDPEAWSFYERIVRKAGEDYDIHVLTNLNGVGNVEVNTFQSAADVVMQKSLREGFGLVISEALWKGKAFVGSSAGGIPMQLDGGRVGRVADTTQEFADAIGDLLDDPPARKALGKAAKEHVRANYLTTRLLADHLRLMNSLSPNGRKQ